jgi:site-specific DNA-methyltransferase (adenine-specific)
MRYLGDCLDVLSEIKTGSVDMVLADPPYGTIAAKWDKIIPFDKLWPELHRACKPNGAIILFGSQPFTSMLACSNLKNFRYCWVWDKLIPSGFNYARFQPMRQHEDIAVFYRERPYYNAQGEAHERPRRQVAAGRSSEASMLCKNDNWVPQLETHKRKRSILRFKKIRLNALHPTQKPVDLLKYLIGTYTQPGQKVLDFCMGSGSTGVACVESGREFLGIEKAPRYFQVAQSRIAAAMIAGIK